MFTVDPFAVVARLLSTIMLYTSAFTYATLPTPLATLLLMNSLFASLNALMMSSTASFPVSVLPAFSESAFESRPFNCSIHASACSEALSVMISFALSFTVMLSTPS